MSGEHEDNYDATIVKINTELTKHVNLTLAMFDLHHTKQGDMGWAEFSRSSEMRQSSASWTLRDSALRGPSRMQLCSA